MITRRLAWVIGVQDRQCAVFSTTLFHVHLSQWLITHCNTLHKKSRHALSSAPLRAFNAPDHHVSPFAPPHIRLRLNV